MADQAFVSEMQYEALFVPPGAEPFPRAVLDEPEIARYHAGFGTRPGDVGVVAEDAEGTPIGAAWVRLVGGYGSVDVDGSAVPELGIAVVAVHRGRGIGTDLLRALFAEAPVCSLSVDDRNPARRLYDRVGFRQVRRDGEAVVMVRDASA